MKDFFAGMLIATLTLGLFGLPALFGWVGYMLAGSVVVGYICASFGFILWGGFLTHFLCKAVGS